MYLKKLSLINFKNIREENLEFRPGINCFVGDNGAGKTNVIDAVYFLSMCKSSLAMTDGQNMRHGSDFFLLDGQYLTDEGRSESVVCAFARKGGKTLKRNGKEYERLSDHVGLIPVVIVSPADTMLISDAADERRRYLNGFISQLDRAYLQALVRYNAVLGERNRLLKMQPDETMLAIYDRQLVEHGNCIHARRREFAARLQPLVAEYYRRLSDDREQVELLYRSELNERPFEEVLRDARQKDLVNEFTTAGIHRDDLTLRIGGYPLRKYGSQGQQKSFLIALKLAQYAIVAAEKGERPILLLDDLFDKLDAGRVEQLIRLVADDAFGQIFITDCNPTRLRTILDRAGGSYTLFTVSNGTITDHTVPEGDALTMSGTPDGATAAEKCPEASDTVFGTTGTRSSEEPGGSDGLNEADGADEADGTGEADEAQPAAAGPDTRRPADTNTHDADNSGKEERR